LKIVFWITRTVLSNWSCVSKLETDTCLVMDPSTAALIAVLVAAGSEIIALLPIRENSWVQVIMKALKIIFPKR
jgi:hypothetical protein